MTEETQQTSKAQANSHQTDAAVPSAPSEVSKSKEGKKEKCRPITKVVIRRLPPTIVEEQFLDQVSPLPDYDYFYFAKADMSFGQNAFCRAYIDFTNPEEVFGFREKFDNYVFVDAKGQEFPAVVEYAPFQRVPKKRIGKKDPKCGTIDTDPYYISFLESLKNQETEVANSQKTEYSFQPCEPKKVTSTPLLDFLKQRKQEKQRIRDEKREEKRRRDLERKRNKDEPMISKVLKNIDDKDKDREFSRENKENKDDKDRLLLKDLKNKNKKDDRYRDKMGRDTKVQNKNYRDRDDRMKDRELKQSKKHDEKKFHNKKDDFQLKDDKQMHEKEEISYKERRAEEKRGKSYEKMRQEKKRQTETQKKQSIEAYEEPNENQDDVEDNENEKGDLNASPVDKNEYKLKKNKRGSGSFKDDGKTEAFEQTIETKSDHTIKRASSRSTDNSMEDKLEDICDRLAQSEIKNTESDEQKSSGSTEKKSPTKARITKRRSSLESGGGDSGCGGKSSGSCGTGTESGGESREDGTSCLRRHKSLDGGNDSNLRKHEVDDKDKDKRDPRTERRIRNKDRPAMEIYRPGMGRFSKQRIEREKGSEEGANPSLSPVPTSGSSSAHKSGKSVGSEVRSMTFKRSISRDIS